MAATDTPERRDLLQVTEPDLPDEVLVYVICDMAFPRASVKVYAGPRPTSREPAVTLQRIAAGDRWRVYPAHDGRSGFYAYTNRRLVVSPDHEPEYPPRWGHYLATPLASDTYVITDEDDDHVVVRLV